MNRLLTEFLKTPWAIVPEYLGVMVTVLHRWASGVKLTDQEIKAAIGRDPDIAAARRANDDSAPRGVAVLPLFGVISNRMRQVQSISGPGGTSTEGFKRQFQSAMDNPAIGAIVLDVDSPGGSVYGIQELADEIAGARGKKKVVAVANSMAASAAYWVASAAEEFYITPGGDVGSIGVIAAHEDWSDYIGKPEAGEFGLPKVEFITAGKYKAEGNPFEPLTDEGRAFIQSRVDDYYKDFIKSVAKNRDTTIEAVKENYGQGRVFGASQALKAGMVDGVDILDNVINRLSSSKSEQQPNRSKHRRSMAIAERI